MRVIIAGCRSIKDKRAVELIDEAVKKSGWQIDEVISGDAAGVDTAAIAWAKANHIDIVRMPANWEKYSKAAGYKRNQKMAWYANIIVQTFSAQEIPVDDKYRPGLIAIWDYKSRGTGHMIDIATELGFSIFIWPPKTSYSQESSEAPESSKAEHP
jgi:hypothetical protein